MDQLREFNRDHDHLRCHNCRFPFIPRDESISPAATASVISRCPFCCASLTNAYPDNSSTPPAPSDDQGSRAYTTTTTTTMINIMTPADLGFTSVHDDDGLEDIDQVSSSSPPASKFFINSLRPIKLTGAILKGLSTTLTSCAICTDEFKQEEKLVYKLPSPCSHWFHCDCILPWLRRKNTCPLCRHEFPNTKENDDQLPAVSNGPL